MRSPIVMHYIFSTVLKYLDIMITAVPDGSIKNVKRHSTIEILTIVILSSGISSNFILSMICVCV